MVYCGDDAGAKKTAAGLIQDVGFEPVDLGALKNARYTEPFALLMGEIAYGGKKGPEVAYRLEWF
jgi:predicted dinucleotide-binding enzyme